MYFDNYHPSTFCSPDSLCPRLLEYLRKKEAYSDNNIVPDISLEQEFKISKNDVKIIREYYKKQHINQSHCWFNDNSYLNQPSINTNNLLNEQFRGGFLEDTPNTPDPKFDELFQKRQMEQIKKNNQRAAQRKKNTTDEYIIYDYKDMRYYDNYMKDIGGAGYFNEYELNSYNKMPTINYHNVIPHSQSLNNSKYKKQNEKYKNDMDYIIGKYDEYGKQIAPRLDPRNDMDTEYKINLPSCSSNGKKHLDSSKYKAVPYMGWGDKKRDVDTENSLIRGSPDTKNKSFGYDTGFEHHFDYISEDIQNADHVVLPFPRGGEDTRRWNKESAQTYYRDIY